MCGRHYVTYTDEELQFQYDQNRSWSWAVDFSTTKVEPQYNTCPTMESLLLYVSEDALRSKQMRWGLVPSWAASIKAADKYSMINARVETIAEKKSFKEAYSLRRGILPLSGFYEWERTEAGKQPYAVYPSDASIMSVACIYECWKSDDGTSVYSYAIVTKEADEVMAKIHHRMPLLLTEEAEALWLDPSLTQEKEFKEALVGRAPEYVSMKPVSNKVNSPRNNDASVLQALSS